MLLPVLIVLVLIPTFLFPLLPCLPGGKQETLGILFQQTAKYMTDHPDEVTEEEKAAIDPLLDYDTIPERYLLTVQDPIKFQNPLYKDYYGIQEIDSDMLKAYLKVWISQGLKHPVTYLEATLGTCLGYSFPSMPLSYLTNREAVCMNRLSISLLLSPASIIILSRHTIY